MRITLRQLQIFVAIAHTGSTSAAADSIALSQSGISASLGELEGLIGTKLFDRIGKRLVLNDVGRGLLPEAQWLLDGAKSIEDGFANGNALASASVKVACSTTIGNYFLPSLIANFRQAAPRTRIEVSIGNTRQVSQLVANFDADVGLIEGPCHERELKVTPWAKDELVIVCAANHPILSGPQQVVSIDQLQQAQWLLREAGSGTREAVEQALLPFLHHIHTDMELGSSEAIKLATAAGDWLTCLSRSVVKDFVEWERLKIVPTELPPLIRMFYLVQHREKHVSASLAKFMAYCQEFGMPAAY